MYDLTEFFFFILVADHGRDKRVWDAHCGIVRRRLASLSNE
jgi:hypothetical protein